MRLNSRRKRKANRRPRIKAITVISDPHYGHIKGLWCNRSLSVPVGADECVPYEPTAGQHYLMNCFDDFGRRVPRGSALVCNGDIIQGVGYPRWHRELVCADPRIQAQAAIIGLRKLRNRCGEAFLVQGTPSHTQDLTDWENEIAAALNMQFSPELVLEIDGKIIQFVHGRSKTQKYPSGMIESEWVDALRQAKEEGRSAPDFIVRSHMHRSIIVDGMGCVTPCWQLPTDFARRSGKSYVTTIGGVIITVRDGLVDCQRIQYPLPPQFRRPFSIRERPRAQHRAC